MNISTILDARVVSDKAFVREAGTNKITKIRVADNPSRKSDRTPCRFLNAEAWGGTGDQLAKLTKGDVVSLTGELKLDKYKDKQGVERVEDVITVTAFRVQKSEAFYGAPKETVPETQVQAPDDDLPF